MIFKDQLQAVYRLIERPEAWTQNAFARNARGGIVDEFDSTAVCWCMVGAFSKVIAIRAVPQFRWLLGMSPNCAISEFNDAPNRQHSEVLSLLNAAIERAPSREGA